MAALAQPDLKETAITEAIAAVVPPKGVRLKRFFFDTDHSGDAALRVVFSVSTKIPLTSARVRDLTNFLGAVNERLWALPSSVIPYIKFEETR